MSAHPIETTGTDVGLEVAEAGESLELIADLHRRQAEMYAGGPMGPVADLLADDVLWQLPGESPAAGEHRSWDAVLHHFAARRELARGTLRMRPEEVVVASREVVIQLLEESVLLDGEVVGWRTAGIYRVGAGRVREAWLVPLDLSSFDRTWIALDRAFG